ncbi:MAG: hypothetical protein L6420_00025 [Elusimicrobia bacterium]|nr:hypothetical protein [Elusimicrobiota bacterium]
MRKIFENLKVWQKTKKHMIVNLFATYHIFPYQHVYISSYFRCCVKALILNPEVFFRNLKIGKINWGFPLAVYFIYIIFNSLFLNYKPLDFPNETAVLNILNPSFFFYLGVQLFWGTLLSLFFVLFALFLTKLFYAFKLPISLFSCLLSALAFFYILKSLDNFLLQCIMLLISAMLIVLIIRKDTNNFLFLLKAAFSVNLISFLFLPIAFLSVSLKSENLFLISELIMSIWLLTLFVKAIKTINNISVLKTVLIFVFSAVGTFGLFYLILKINLLSENTLKVILSM